VLQPVWLGTFRELGQLVQDLVNASFAFLGRLPVARAVENVEEEITRVRSQLSLSICRSVLLYVAMSVRSSAGFGILRWRRSQPGIRPSYLDGRYLCRIEERSGART